MFYPLRTLKYLNTCGSYSKKFQGELTFHLEEQQKEEQKQKNRTSDTYRNTDKKYKF